MPKVKICGLTRVCDIEAVNNEQPDYIGFMFAQSRRKITPRQAFELRGRLDPGIIPVGVFVDEKIENVVTLAENGVIDIIQLHGSEDEEYIEKIIALTGKPVIKAIPVQKKGDVQTREKTSADYLLLDNSSGGSGRNFLWELIGSTEKPYFLAGGLSPENVTDAIDKTKPFAVDVSSGVETDGVKDPVKIREFIRKVRNYVG
jgi:phosphoribosylanthranilate isomerase